MATHFQQLGPADAELFTEHLARWHREDGTPVSSGQLRQEAARILGDNEGWHAWLIHEGGATAGYLVLQFRSGSRAEVPRAYVAALYVPPALRHLRLGRPARRLLADLGRWLGVRVLDFDTEREDKHLHLSHRARRPLISRPATELVTA